MHIRPATEEDASAIADAWYAMMSEAGLLAPNPPQNWRERFTERVANGIKAGTQYWVVADDGGAVVATGGALMGDRQESIASLRAFIVGMYTQPAHRRRGYAHAIAEQLVQWCREQGCAEIRLQASDAGRPLYEAMGFVTSNEMVLDLSE